MEIYNDTYCVYIHTNKINGKKYVGQTKHGDNPERKRWKYGDGYKCCKYFYHAIKKYGWNLFDHEIIASNLTLDEANHFEELLISKLDTINPDNGYNIKSGGDNNYILTDIQNLKRIQTLKNNIREKHKQQSYEKYQQRFNDGDESIIQCKKCGALFEIKPRWNKEHTKKINTKARKYCNDCRNIMYTKSTNKVITCIDCGVDIIVNPNATAVCRCKECQIQHRKKKNKERQRKYYSNQKQNSVNQN